MALLGAWRLIAIVDAAGATGGRRAFRVPRVGIPVAGLIAVTIVVHGILGYDAWTFYQAGTRMFVGVPDPDIGGAPFPGTSVRPGPILAAPPFATPPTLDSRINVLLTGIDSGAQRRQRLNDTLIVVSIDPVSRQVAMISFPRDLSQLPLWDGRTYPDKINSLMTYAQGHRAEFPDGGLPTLMKEIGFLLGVPIHYYAALDLGGFVTMVDLVGGVDVDNQRTIDDPGYGGWTNGHPIGFYLPARTPPPRRAIGARLRSIPEGRRGQRLHPVPPPAAAPRRAGQEAGGPGHAPEAAGPRPGGRGHDPDELPAGPTGRSARSRVVGR